MMSTIDTFSGESTKSAHRARVVTARPSFFAQMSMAIGWVNGRMEKRRSRKALLELTDDQLKDIGLSRGEAYSEAARPLWD